MKIPQKILDQYGDKKPTTAEDVLGSPCDECGMLTRLCSLAWLGASRKYEDKKVIGEQADYYRELMKFWKGLR